VPSAAAEPGAAAMAGAAPNANEAPPKSTDIANFANMTISSFLWRRCHAAPILSTRSCATTA
jgi:hypothetical protein